MRSLGGPEEEEEEEKEEEMYQSCTNHVATVPTLKRAESCTDSQGWSIPRHQWPVGGAQVWFNNTECHGSRPVREEICLPF